MANAILRVNLINKAYQLLELTSLLLLIQKASALHQFTVGGSKGWTVPTNPYTSVYDQWGENIQFVIGDSLLFVYQADSVLLVTKEDYISCNTRKPVRTYTSGHTVFKFIKSGPHYFISGTEENCHNNEKLVVVVMAHRKDDQASLASPPRSTIVATFSPIFAFFASSSLLLV